MSLFITSLNSGSNGNCYYIGTQTEAVLIDAGLSCRETEKRMKLLNLSMDIVKAIFISHEHTDHIKGLAGLVSKYNLPYYITAGTFKRSGLVIKKQRNEFVADEPISIGNINVIAFAKNHDAADPHSFIITNEGITAGVFTDIGIACNKLIHYFSQCHAAFLEANYDEAMLENGNYPIHLKNRIRSNDGHLSNRQALEIFTSHKPAFMTHLLLSHLSKENNSPTLVKELFKKYAGDTKILVASRYEATEVISIDSSKKGDSISKPATGKGGKIVSPMQMNLFD